MLVGINFPVNLKITTVRAMVIISNEANKKNHNKFLTFYHCIEFQFCNVIKLFKKN